MNSPDESTIHSAFGGENEMSRVSRVTGAVMFVALLGMLGFPATAIAQSAGSIAGIVRDTSGGVMPGVTVEAASPVLIEKVRTVVTDAQGNYKIVDLRPGTYTVTFTLPGFSVVKREGIELTQGFTANVNADLTVGSLEETLTVTGATPIVDIQNVVNQTVLSREVLDTLPTNKTMQGFATLTLGANLSATSQDVGGNQGDTGGTFGVHGGRAGDTKVNQDGMLAATSSGTGGGGGFGRINQNVVQEIALQTGGISAEFETGGVQINLIPKDGGNALAVNINASGAAPKFQSENLSEAMKIRGLTSVPSLKKIYDVGGSVGGPFKVNKLWGFIAYRTWGTENYVPGSYYNKLQGTYIGAPNSGVVAYEPDFSKPAYSSTMDEDLSGRITWQATEKQKLAVFQGAQRNHNVKLGAAGTAPEAAIWGTYSPALVTQGTWNYPATNRLLFEAGATYLRQGAYSKRMPGVKETDIPIQELSTGFRYGASGPANASANYSCNCKIWNPHTQRFAVSLITGSHAFKAGAIIIEGFARDSSTFNTPPVAYTFRNGVPQTLTEFVEQTGDSRVKANAGIFVQDQWTLRRLTLNLGLRFSYFNAFVPAARIEKQMFVTEAWDAPAVYNVPNETDIDPRVGFAYDLFGNGRTALKASVGRYVQIESTKNITIPSAPLRSMAQSATRTWTDANGNYVPDCNLPNPLANGECGQVDQLNIGKQIPSTVFAEDVRDGFGIRAYSWMGSVSITQQLTSGVGLHAGYFRTNYGNFTVTTNDALTAADFDSYCVTAPVDDRLGSTSGQQLCGFYDVKPGKFGQVRNVVTQASNFGEQTELYNGFEIGMNARFPRGAMLQGGMSTGTTVTDNCAVVQGNPQIALSATGGGVGARDTNDFCRAVNGFQGQTQYKFAGNYPLPWWGLQTSATYQNLPGIPIVATRPYTSAQIAQSLGRNLSAGANSNVTIALMKPYSQFQNRISQLDMRFLKNVRWGGTRRLQAQIDVYNVFNSATILSQRAAYGTAWQEPQIVLGGRMLKLGMQLDF
jgi:hypothetical protein